MFYDHGYKSGGVGVFIDGTSQHNTFSSNVFTRAHAGIAFNYAVQTASTVAGNVITRSTVKGLTIGKSFHNVSTGENIYSDNTVVERGQRTAITHAVGDEEVFDASLSHSLQVALSAAATSSTLINGHQGQRITISRLQDSTSGRTYAWPTNVRFVWAAPATTVAY